MRKLSRLVKLVEHAPIARTDGELVYRVEMPAPYRFVNGVVLGSFYAVVKSRGRTGRRHSFWAFRLLDTLGAKRVDEVASSW
jgi:hypothetical protein